MTDVRETGLNVFRELLPGLISRRRRRISAAAGSPTNCSRSPSTTSSVGCGDVTVSAAATAASSRWACSSRCGPPTNWRIHFKIARTNGLTDDEIAEVIYHSSGYAGFPAAATANRIAGEALSE